jgi:protein-tyrosine phosphatase
MNQIVPHLLWIGHAGDGRDYRRILDTGIQAIIQLAVEEPPLQPPRELIYCRFPLVDGTGNPAELLRAAVRTVLGFLETAVPTLICCGAGMSRSPAIAAAALAVVRKQSPEQCLELVVRHHSSDVSPGLWSEVVQLRSVHSETP